MIGWWILIAAILPVESPVDFDNDIVPILTKAGCNTGACHGAAVGRGGFRLSLYGGDPESDFRAIALELQGRRINLSHPDQSLVLLKPTEAMEHEGGMRFNPDSKSARLLAKWIHQGARRRSSNDDKPTRVLESLEVHPKSVVLESDNETLHLRSVAHFSDGSSEDVTEWTVFTPDDTSALKVDTTSAKTRVLRRGRHIVIARYLNKVVAIEVIRPLSDQPVTRASKPARNFIDRHVDQVLSTLQIPASQAADDATFLRRVTLDLTGRLPTAKAFRLFRQDKQIDRRASLVDQLLQSDAFVDYWTYQLAKLFRIRSQGQDIRAALVYHQWLKQQVADDAGYDKIASNLLTSIGDTHQSGPANFYRTAGGPREQAEFASELFMGNRLRCANCHNHPLDKWTQDDYHGLAAIFAKVKPGKIVALNPSGQVIHPRTGGNAEPRLPGIRFLNDTDPPLETFSDWLTTDNNPYFAKAIVNRLWKALMGRGLVEPVDDLRDTNPATHPALLDNLATDFAANEFKLRRTLRRIALSDTYARQSEATSGNEADDRFYSHSLRRPLQAEVLADAISDVLDVPETYGGMPIGTRAVTLFDPTIDSDSLDVLGRCSRQDTCETSSNRTDSGGLPRKLHLFNGALLNKRIASDSGRLSHLLKSGVSNDKVVEAFYLSAFSRVPSAKEQDYWRQQLGSDRSPIQRRIRLEDFVWSVLTCNEFVTNH